MGTTEEEDRVLDMLKKRGREEREKERCGTSRRYDMVWCGIVQCGKAWFVMCHVDYCVSTKSGTAEN